MATTLVRVPRPRRRGSVPRLPRPAGLRGVARRPIPIDGLARMVRTHIAATVKKFERRTMGKLEDSGLLADLYRAATEDGKKNGRAKEIVGQSGAPLGEERASRIRRVLNTKEIEVIGRLFGDESDGWRLELENILKQDYLTLYNAGGRGARLKLRVSGSFNVRNPFILDALAERANLISGISDNVFDRLLTVVAEEGFVFGKSPIDVGRALEDEFDFLSSTRARRIAHQETLTITEEAETTLWEASGVPFKRWLTTLDGKERPRHFELHGQIKAIDEPFEVDGIEIMQPGDPDAPPDMTFFCRCAKIPIVTTDQVFSDAKVWDGSNDPDEFSKERIAEREGEELESKAVAVGFAIPRIDPGSKPMDVWRHVLQHYRRVALTGGPQVGKTTTAKTVMDRPILHSDDFKHFDWPEVPWRMIEAVKDLPSFIIEGVQVARAIRKGMEVDALVVFHAPLVSRSPGQVAMARGIDTILGKLRLSIPRFDIRNPIAERAEENGKRSKHRYDLGCRVCGVSHRDGNKSGCPCPEPPGRPGPCACEGGAGTSGSASTARSSDYKGSVNTLHQRAKELDREITPAFQQAVSSAGGKAVGLDYRIKASLERAEQKLREKAAESGTGAENPEQHLHDMLRYTATWPPEEFGHGRDRFLAEMERAGFNIYDSKDKNYWQGEFYKGDNYVFAHKSGFTFEVQMHTPDSFRTKEAQHGLYEEFRAPGTSAERRKDLVDEMRRQWDGVVTPREAMRRGHPVVEG